jgi:hypothetical protein
VRGTVRGRGRGRLAWLGVAIALLAACAAPGGAPTGSAPPPSAAPALAAPTRQHVTGRVPAPGSCRYRTAADGQPLPDPACTPGATDPRVTQATIAETICVTGYTARVRPPVQETDRVKHGLMLAYGTEQPNELDHLIPLELGGSSDVRNLWPEPPPSPNPKDRVESALHDLVCAAVRQRGAPYLPLRTAQRLIAADWTTAPEQARRALVR